MRIHVLLMLISTLCLGQQCTPSAIIGSQTGIPAGVYRGNEISNTTMTANSTQGPEGPESEQKTNSNILSKSFGPEGLLLTTQNTPISVGDYSIIDMGAGKMTSVISNIKVDSNLLIVVLDDTLDLIFPDNSIVTLYGVTTDTYELIAPNQVSYSSIHDSASTPINGVYLSFHRESTGVLTR